MPTRTFDFHGHLIDQGLLTRVMDAIPKAGGTFRVLHFAPGITKEEESSIGLAVEAANEDRLASIALELLNLGGREVRDDDEAAKVSEVERDGVAPLDFYSTTIFPTSIRLACGWVPVEDQRMDAVVVISGEDSSPQAHCRLIRDLRRGDRVVCGSKGIRVEARLSNREDSRGEDFKFMGSAVSSERRVEAAVDQVAGEMRALREEGGRIVVVAGPVVVHTGGAPHLGSLIRNGYVQALLGGNAIAVHDIEAAFFGTSLGVDLARGRPVGGGHRHHINAINLVRHHGGIRAAVEAGALTSGIMYEVIRAGIPYSLAGSIRDDGPLPETEMDLLRAQEEYTRLLKGARMVLMLSSMLHSIGVGNMTPAGVRMICVDINPAVATKLADRGSIDSTPIVTDVGLFLHMLARKLEVPG